MTRDGGPADHLLLWDLKTGKKLGQFEGHTLSVFHFAFTPDGTQLVSGSHDRTVRIWDVKTQKAVRVLSGHRHWVNDVVVSPDGALIASAANDGTVSLWSVASGAHLYRFLYDGEAGALAWTDEEYFWGLTDYLVFLVHAVIGLETRLYIEDGNAMRHYSRPRDLFKGVSR